jgi:dipeptidyl-peptidase-4
MGAAEPAGWRLDIDDLARRPPPGVDAPEDIRFTPDGAALTFLHGPGLIRSLWRLDLATGRRRRLAAPDDPAGADAEPSARGEQRRRARTRTYARGITRYAWAGPPARPVLLVPVGGQWLVGIGSDPELVPLDTLAGAGEALLSPDGRRIAFVRDGDVWLAIDGEAEPRRITHDAAPGVMNGVAEYIAAEELARHDGMWWSRDGRVLAIARVDERAVDEIGIAHLGTSGELERHRYPRPGRPNAEVRLRLALLEQGRLVDVPLPMEAGDYLARVVPLPQRGFLVAVLPRAQHELRWVRVAPDGSVLDGWTERGGLWINLDDDTRPLDDGRILRTTERSGFRHLEIRDRDGAVRQLTDGPWVVTRVVGVDDAGARILFVATKDGITERHVYAVPLDGGEPVRLSSERGWHDAVLSPDGRRWVDSWSSRERSPGVVVRESEGNTMVAEVHVPSFTSSALGLPPPELLDLRAEDGATLIHAAFYRVERDDCPPLVVSTYGGPHSQKVMEHWSLTVDMTAQLLAQRGFAVLVVDNRGTYNRGAAFEAPIHRRLGTVEVADTAAVVRQLVERGLVDGERVGIIGSSYGGFMVLRAMAARPDLFRVGIAGAPVVDWALYDSAYTERYLGTPEADPEAYRASSVTANVDALRGRLLVTHGVIDENVHLRHTVRLAAAMRGAGLPLPDVLLLPDERHGVRGAHALRSRAARMVEHLEAGLGTKPTPPSGS